MSTTKVHPFTDDAEPDVQSLAAAVKGLQAEVAELKASGGGGGGDAPPESPYSFVIGVLFDRSSPIKTRVMAIALITFLVVFQLILCFGFTDTAALQTAAKERDDLGRAKAVRLWMGKDHRNWPPL